MLAGIEVTAHDFGVDFRVKLHAPNVMAVRECRVPIEVRREEQASARGEGVNGIDVRGIDDELARQAAKERVIVVASRCANRADFSPHGILDDAPAESLREHLVAKTDSKHGQGFVDARAQPRLGADHPRRPFGHARGASGDDDGVEVVLWKTVKASVHVGPVVGAAIGRSIANPAGKLSAAVGEFANGVTGFDDQNLQEGTSKPNLRRHRPKGQMARSLSGLAREHIHSIHVMNARSPADVQLLLPLDDGLIGSSTPSIARHRRVFCNRNLKMAQVAWVGFDMDYTLAVYDQRAMDELSVRCIVERLVSRHGYSETLLAHSFPSDFAVRGLLIDKKLGHILKMDRHKNVTRAYHGLRELSRDEVRTLYHAKRVRPATPRYHWIDTLYALCEGTVYGGVVDACERQGEPLDYGKLFDHVRDSIDSSHYDGTIQAAILPALDRFVVRDPDLAPTLHKLRSAGKKLFLLTNSHWPYTDVVMRHLLEGVMPEYPQWRTFFDVVVCAASKPAFFQERRPLMERDGLQVRPATFPLERGRIYEGGNLHDLERGLGISGDQILYVGDHIYGDILRSKKESAWRTCMVMQELEGETFAYETCREDFFTLDALEAQRDHLEEDLRYYQSRFKGLTKRLAPPATEPDRTRFKRAIERIRGRLRQVDWDATALERRIGQRFHPYWGSLLKEGNEASNFGAQVELYGCLYTSRVTNLFAYSAQQHFRSARDVMPHELG